ncbi:hypothetical protein QJQ45_002165 [Haematococcus lacustris]|nr:hypothetical protein QJQ45_002165 [Haematococcus lacustris]
MPPKRNRKRPVSPAPSAAGASGSGQQVQGKGQAAKVVIAERRQVIKAGLRGLVEAALPDFSPAQVDAIRIGESKQRPLELCRWDDLEALPPIGKEYQQGYKRLNDRLPKVKQRLHRAA